MKTHIAEWLVSMLHGKQLLFVTLTCPRRVERDELSHAIGRLIHRVKRRVLGRKAERAEIAQVIVLEPTYMGGAHAHLILEDPYSLPTAKPFPCAVPIGRLITKEWANLGIGGNAVAQDVQRVYDLPGVIQYLQKTLGGTHVLDRLDINNFCLPNRSALSPIPNSHVPPVRDNK